MELALNFPLDPSEGSFLKIFPKMKTVLLHICCGPCAISPVGVLEQQGYEVDGFFYNPNIHPFSEYKRRLEAVVGMSERLGLDVLYHRYDFEDFLRKMSAFHQRSEQHRFCWQVRLEETAKMAQAKGIGAFTTTLLSSPYQDIEQIKVLGRQSGAQYGLDFLDLDFRAVFSDSHKFSREWKLYHQNYCGCLYSEKESIEGRQKKGKKD